MKITLTKKTKIFILAIIVIAYIILCANMGKLMIETWENYKQLQYGNISTGTNPLTFYRRDVYRKPYRYPVCNPVNYPTEHCQTFSI